MGTEGKRISVAMTTYNGEKYIEKQLRSIFAQSLQPDEIVICDDCSKDRTVEIIHQIVSEYQAEDRVRVVENEQNLGYIRNFYKAIGMTSGDYLFLADQDDEWYSNKVERILEVILETGAEVICTGYDLIDENSDLINDTDRLMIDPVIRDAAPGLTAITFNQLIFRNFVPGCTYCCTRNTVKAFLAIESQVLPHDYQMMFIGSVLGKVYFLNEKTIRYRLHGNNTIGIPTKGSAERLIGKKVNKKPKYLQFLDAMHRIVPIPNKWIYNVIFYLRIPFLIGVIKSSLDSI